jgi:hypothetical protein
MRCSPWSGVSWASGPVAVGGCSLSLAWWVAGTRSRLTSRARAVRAARDCRGPRGLSRLSRPARPGVVRARLYRYFRFRHLSGPQGVYVPTCTISRRDGHIRTVGVRIRCRECGAKYSADRIEGHLLTEFRATTAARRLSRVRTCTRSWSSTAGTRRMAVHGPLALPRPRSPVRWPPPASDGRPTLTVVPSDGRPPTAAWAARRPRVHGGHGARLGVPAGREDAMRGGSLARSVHVRRSDRLVP